ncbi:vacuolar protein sorting-associated [Gorgonomyces haynaldii]|nr:vacuolar protein sorting-associated [Gorgonomyces haynaldii]
MHRLVFFKPKTLSELSFLDRMTDVVKIPQSERQKYDHLADLYSILVATEHLERLYISDRLAPQDYTPLCLKLIAQYKTSIELEQVNIQDFIKTYQLQVPAAYKRLVELGVPATVEHSHQKDGEKKQIAETVSSFITLMDSLQLGLLAVDQIHPQLTDLVQHLNKQMVQYENKQKLRDWLIQLNQLKASDELNQEQVRQLLFDLQQSHNEFNHWLSAK